MRFVLYPLFIFIFTAGYSISGSDSTKSKINISGNVSINSNGIASIPAFSLGKPALIASFAVQKNRFSYDPVVSYGLNMRPWIIDNWIHYRPVSGPKFDLRAGVDFSMFFSHLDSVDTRILQAQQYITFEIAGIYKISPESSLSAMYWSDNGQDPGSLKGNFYNVVYDRSDIGIGPEMIFSANIQLFYIDYTGNNDGLFISPRFAAVRKGLPLTVFFQATQGIVSNIEPFPGFKWNVGLGYLF